MCGAFDYFLNVEDSWNLTQKSEMDDEESCDDEDV